ncbi:response regulator [Bacillus luteolus]|uniref:histidine kinase n=1 Tax=Litchfieldia luteola TaxID=682179 RepID=A0ABR9QKG2_9BACI|nr:ATP-binding protein [Cytobacillus luteolus]MBE4908934.1 response regulator [Cytobacillus luteolus]MBP1941793.1 signal transduction histidine kinase/CheY-like chemotaxis protein [Cytobacillus luteolus]
MKESKVNKYFRKSLARKFFVIVSTFFFISFVSASLFLWYQEQLTQEYGKRNEIIEQKETIAQGLDNAFNEAFFQSRGYVAIGNEEMRNAALETKDKINKELDELNELLERIEQDPDHDIDTQFYMDISTFTQDYFEVYLLEFFSFRDKGELEGVREFSDSGVTLLVTETRNRLSEYRLAQDEKVEENFKELNSKILESQIAFIIFLGLLLLALLFLIRYMVKQIGKPLSELAIAAGDVANGKMVSLIGQTDRDDELGALSRSFNKMVQSIYENEQDLTAQNEELHAQQDELQSQQIELQRAISIMQHRELELERRNELINGLANSLDKQQVLQSIVENMCKLIEADCGVIALLQSKGDYAGFGITTERLNQFMNHLENGQLSRIIQKKKGYSIKRSYLEEEQGYHTHSFFCYDLFLPVVSFGNEVEAVMVYTRYGNDFTNEEIEEYEALAKQISISLENVKLFEQTEADRLLTQDILNTLHEGILLVDQNGKVLQVNDQVCQLLECKDPSTLINAPFSNWTKDFEKVVENNRELLDFYQDALMNGSSKEQSFIYHIKEPIKRVIHVYCEPLYRNKQKIGTILVHRDITKEFEVDQMKSEFVSTVSHELRTPLASVLGFTELLLHKELKQERQKKYLTTIYQEAKRLTALINDFLDVQRMEAGKQSYEKKYEDILPIIKGVIETNQVNSKEHSIKLINKASETIILCDKDKISQVFNNLISNAIKYSPDGGDVILTVYDEEEYLKVDIRDQGLGIPADAIPNLFQKFYRIDNSDRRKIGGTGLGLAIVKEIVEAHEGYVGVRSSIKEGSTFTITIPQIKGHQTAASEPSLAKSLKHADVVIIEDDMNLASLLSAELKESGLHVKHYKEGREALSGIKDHPPDAIVLDIMLAEKGMDGWDIIRELKSDTKLSSIPVFISSALEEKEKGTALGANDYLIKPYSPSKLTNTILQTLLQKDRTGEIHIPKPEKD